MKRKILVSALCLAALSVLSCSKEHDLTVLHGEWESTGYEIHLTPDDPMLKRAAEKMFAVYVTSFRLRFYNGEVYENEFQEFRYRDQTQLSLMTGDFFYNHGYKARLRIFDLLWGNTPLELFPEGDRLLCRGNATEYFHDPTILESMGIDPKNNPIRRVEVDIRYKRVATE